MSRIALLSAYRKNDKLREFAFGLLAADFTIFASSGTKRFLDQSYMPVTDVSEMVGPPIFGHRVVTLDRLLFAALLARKDEPEDMDELARMGIKPIDLVYVDMYPLAKELENPARTVRSILEQIDNGGPALLRAAAKGQRYAISGPEQLDRVLKYLTSDQVYPEYRFLAQLAFEAEKRISEYTALAATFYQSIADGNM